MIIHHINKITSTIIPFEPEVILLDYWGESDTPVSTRELIALLIFAAKCELATVWELPKIPSIKEWYMNVWDLMVADKLSECILFIYLFLHNFFIFYI